VNFYHQKERLERVGEDDEYVKRSGGRKKVFEIAGDEQLIGCQLE
jgi:hypothetical protein